MAKAERGETGYRARGRNHTTADETATDTIDLGGNEFAQTVIGNAGANILRGFGVATTDKG